MARAFKLASVALAAALLALVALTLPAAPAATGGSRPVEARDYDLGVVELPDAGPRGPLPVRLWGAIAIPGGPGPFPLAIVAHGRHGDDCLRHDRLYEWPCWSRELRSDLGLRHIAVALARRGVAAIVPDLNGGFTIGWNDRSGRRHRALWPEIVDRTRAALAEAVAGRGPGFGLPLAGRIDLSRPPGILAHSLSGADAVRYAESNPVSALLLLAPAYEFGLTLPEVDTTIVASRCDYDVPGQAHRYFALARRSGGRRAPVFFIRLEGADHNYYNSTLSRLGRDDGKYLFSSEGCRRSQRLSARAQQHWIDELAAAFFAAELRGARPPAWMRPQGLTPRRLYDHAVRYEAIHR